MKKAFLILGILSFAISFGERSRASDLNTGKVRGIAGFFLQRLDTNQSPLKSPSLDKTTHWGGLLGVQAGLTEVIVADLQVSFGEFEYYREVPGNHFIVEKGHRVHIPLLFRFWIVDYFSIAGGFYASYRVGGVEVVKATNSPVNETSASDVGEHGLEVATTFHWPLPFAKYLGYIEYRRGYSLTPRTDEGRDRNWLIIGVSKDI